MSSRPDQSERNEPQGARAWGEQNADGVDLSLIRENLRLTPAERLDKNYAYRRQVLRLRTSARRIG